MYNINGVLAGDVTERGYRVSVEQEGSTLSANMEIIVRTSARWSRSSFQRR